MPTQMTTPSREQAQTLTEPQLRISALAHLAWVVSFLLWRGFYFFTVVVIPALGWR